MRLHHAIILGACGLVLLGCAKKERHSAVLAPGGVEEQVGNTAIVRMQAPAFDKLSPNDRAAAYYLSQAILAGRDITCDQIYPGQTRALRFLEKMSLNLDYGATPGTIDPFRTFLKVVQIHNGFYDLNTGRKISSGDFDARALTNLLFLSQANSGGQIGTLVQINIMHDFMVDTLLNPGKDSLWCARDSKTGDVTALPVGFYDLVPPAEAAAFVERFPANSRLILRDGRPAEHVCRAGDDEVAPGLYAAELDQVIANLEKGRPYFPPARIAPVDMLIRHLGSGDPAAYDSAAALWRSGPSPVDFILGFADTRFDPLDRKGLWTGLLFIPDETAQGKIDRLLADWPQLAANLPGGYKPAPQRRFKAVQLLTAVGAGSPRYPDVYRDPACPSGTAGISQSLIFTNIIAARAQARALMDVQLCDNDGERAAASKYAIDLELAQAALGEAARESGSDCPAICGSQPQRDDRLLREVLAQAQVLWLMGDPRLVGTGLLPDSAAWNELYPAFARRFQIALLDTTGTENWNVLKLTGNYLVQAGALTVQPGANAHYRPADRKLMREKAGELAAQAQTLVVNGTAASRHEFVSKYGAGTTPPSVPANAFTEEAFILPLLQAKLNPMGGLQEVRLEQPESFSREMLLYSGLEPARDKK